MKKFIYLCLIFCIFMSGCSINGSREDKGTGSSDTPVVAADAPKDASGGNQEGEFKWPDGEWSTSDPEAQQLDSDWLDRADQKIKDNYPNIYSLLVVRHGYMVYEKYYQGMDRDRYNPVYSVTKSVLSALTGIALREKVLESTGQKVSELLPEYFSSIDNPEKKNIDLKDVLTMSGGLESIDNDYGGYFTSGDWLDYAIKKPLTDQPGSKFVYNTGLTHVLSGIIAKKSGRNTMEFADQYLFGPLGIDIKRWDRDGLGIYSGGTGLYLTPGDMAKLGLLYLNNGKWKDEQIIPEEWVKESVSAQIQVSPELNYGYLFWVEDLKDQTSGKIYHTYRADGAGGQKILVIPELDMLVVITANLNSASGDGRDTQELIPDFILPAVK